ncbi:hypothetical protein EK21DRAFT_70076 [Setomelanomma holmii]|uniref:Pentatricopeptide repeat-containing protein-mitochondrial domain-containing protein n=1 Tax=Setomelanomma holmii TaxID=210430 RepID=A0A9P4LLV4_9PLEO|nr:hypothetical protein EK21DRAFT_70076 [Setomelanomma holmii]
MPPRLVANDALWRCLCPGIFRNVSVSTAGRPAAASALRRRLNRPKFHPLRVHDYSTATSSYSDALFSQPNAPTFRSSQLLRAHQSPRDKPPLAQLPTHILYEHLRNAGAKGHFDEVFSICRVLVKDRGEPPNKDMYTAILHSFVSASNGTAGKVRKVLEDMGFWADAGSGLHGGHTKIELDARGCECVLEVLAVHPDYLLRTEILEYMKSRWFALSDRGHNFLIAGLLRERHFEQALEMLDDMARRKTRIENWLFDKALWTLLEFGEVEEAFYVLGLRDGVWNTQVEPGYLKPGTGACHAVLALAARFGDVHLATDVFRVLTERGTVFTTHHYELLITTYLNAKDLSAALSVLLIMGDANLKVNIGTCQPLYWYLRREKAAEISRSMAAFNMLQNFEAFGCKVPTAAINACMQASIVLDRFEEAIEIYKALHTVSKSGPDTQTFNVLFQGCHKNNRKELAMFFANEMIQLDLKPDRLTYDRLILVCLQADDLEDALLYYEEMRSLRAKLGSAEMMRPRRGTWEELIVRCAKVGDERAVAMLKEYKHWQEEPRLAVERAVKERFQVAPSETGRADEAVFEETRPKYAAKI